MNDDLRTEKEILNGNFKLITELNEFRMSLWVNGFGIVDGKTQQVILPLNTTFNLDDFTEHEHTIEIDFRIYHNGNVTYNVIINPFEKSFTYLTKVYALNDFNPTFFETESSN